MDFLYELENLAVIAETHLDHDGPFQDLLQKPAPTKDRHQSQQKPQLQPHPHPRPRDHKTTYLVKLEGPLCTASKVQELARMTRLPEQVSGTGDESGDATFCFVNGAEKTAISTALSGHNQTEFTPTFIRINRAHKALATGNMAPCLGFDPTLPQHRPAEATQTFLPSEDQYPVWYFFYGTLTDPDVLIEKLELDTLPVLRSVTVKGAQLRTWGGKYKALVDGVGAVAGWAYEVTCAEHEEALRYYETDQYEVVRCAISMADTGEDVWGLTFRFIGD
ncbi:hypothetical protein BJX70DRAFT_17400 [Aspergillus crustosus]